MAQAVQHLWARKTNPDVTDGPNNNNGQAR